MSVHDSLATSRTYQLNIPVPSVPSPPPSFYPSWTSRNLVFPFYLHLISTSTILMKQYKRLIYYPTNLTNWIKNIVQLHRTPTHSQNLARCWIIYINGNYIPNNKDTSRNKNFIAKSTNLTSRDFAWFGSSLLIYFHTGTIFVCFIDFLDYLPTPFILRICRLKLWCSCCR